MKALKTCHLQGDTYFSVLITLVVNFSFWELKCLHANCSLMTVYWVVLLCWEGYTLIFFFSSDRHAFCYYVLEVFSRTSSQALQASWHQHTHRHAQHVTDTPLFLSLSFYFFIYTSFASWCGEMKAP